MFNANLGTIGGAGPCPPVYAPAPRAPHSTGWRCWFRHHGVLVSGDVRSVRVSDDMGGGGSIPILCCVREMRSSKASCPWRWEEEEAHGLRALEKRRRAGGARARGVHAREGSGGQGVIQIYNEACLDSKESNLQWSTCMTIRCVARVITKYHLQILTSRLIRLYLYCIAMIY